MKKPIYICVLVAGVLFLSGVNAQTTTAAAPDNSVVNKRDHSPSAKTADRQADASKSDTEITRMIRRELTKDDSLSTYAKNIKIITTAGSITLRGPVHSAEEKFKIGEVAKNLGSDRTLINQLEVKQQAQKEQN